MKAANERDGEILQLLLEHPFLDDGISAEGAYNYLLGRTHHQKRQERWKQSSRVLAYWMKKMGFTSRRTGDVNKYSWPKDQQLVGADISE
tara:strand:- start:208 stop:477 length:270 start_codon:yes stop_codon:yes gene_type:complete